MDENENEERDNSFEVLKKDIKKKKGKRVKDNTVVRFSKTFSTRPGARVYNYVAVFIEATGMWYTTGSGEMSTLTYEDMVDELSTATDVEVVTKWKAMSV